MSREAKLGRALLSAFVIVGVLAFLSALTGCPVKAEAAAPPVDTSHVIIALGRFVGGCHACPVSAHEALTAAHCVDIAPEKPEVPLYPLRGESASGWSGILDPVGARADVDLAKLTPTPAFEVWYSRGARPIAGDEVALVGFDRGERDSPLGPKVVRGKVTSVVAGHFSTTAFGGPGSSGGCVLDAASRVVGIVSSGLRGEDEGDRMQTVAVGVWEGAE